MTYLDSSYASPSKSTQDSQATNLDNGGCRPIFKRPSGDRIVWAASHGGCGAIAYQGNRGFAAARGPSFVAQRETETMNCGYSREYNGGPRAGQPERG